MNREPICVLCRKNEEVSKAPGKDALRLEYDVCKNYDLASPELFKKSYTEMPREKRAMISSYTRMWFELSNDWLELENPSDFEDIITEYEAKTIDEKVENLILHLRKKSSQFAYLDSMPVRNIVECLNQKLCKVE